MFGEEQIATLRGQLIAAMKKNDFVAVSGLHGEFCRLETRLSTLRKALGAASYIVAADLDRRWQRDNEEEAALNDSGCSHEWETVEAAFPKLFAELGRPEDSLSDGHEPNPRL